jgi:hypothetical protein
MSEARERRAVPDWQLERLRLQELPAQDMAALAALIADDEALRQRLDGLAADDRAVLAELRPAAMAAAIRSRSVASPAPAARRLPLWLPAFASAAVLLIAVGAVVLGPVRRPSTSEPPRLEPTRIKGLRPEILLFRKTASGAEPLTRASVAHAGDVVQLAYQAAGRRYGAVVSVDSRGTVTFHLPRNGPRAAELVPGANVPLPTAYELDDAPRWETFYLVAASQPFDLDLVVAAARAVASTPAGAGNPARLALPAGFEQSAFLLRKDLPR